MLDSALAQGIDAPPALLALFAQLDALPAWVDWNRIDRGGGVFLRSGAIGMMILNLACLPLMYSSPAGTKPLVFTGQLLRRAPRRLAETARFKLETSRPGGLRRGGEGFGITVKVRLMHAQVRRLLRRSGRWDAAWGEPVNRSTWPAPTSRCRSSSCKRCAASAWASAATRARRCWRCGVIRAT